MPLDNTSPISIRRFLDATLRHLPPENQRQVLDLDDGGLFSSWPQPEYGAFVYVPEEAILLADLPDSVQRLFAMARAHRCDYILFDVDGPEIAGFDLYAEYDE